MFCICKLGPLLFEYSLLRLQLYLGFIFSLSMNESIASLLHVSLNILFTLLAFKLSFRGAIPEIITVLLSVLHLLCYHILPQCITVVSGFCLIVGSTYDFMPSVFAPGKCHTINLFSYRISPTCLFNNRVSNENIHFFYCDRFFDFLSVD